MPELSLGSVLPHRFVIAKRMQSGGLGLIFRAGDRQTHRDVARKLQQGVSQNAAARDALAMRQTALRGQRLARVELRSGAAPLF